MKMNEPALILKQTESTIASQGMQGMPGRQSNSQTNTLEAGSVEGAAPVDVRGVGWKEIVLTRDDFEQLNFRLSGVARPIPPVEVTKKPDGIFVFALPLLYFVLVFKDEIQISEYIERILKFVLFAIAVFYIWNDDTLENMRVNRTSRILIGFCFGGLLVASSTV